MRSYKSRVCGCPEAKPRENRKRESYAERLTHALAIVYLTYTTQACAVFKRVIFLHSDVIRYLLPPFSLALKPSNGVLASGDPITPSNTVKYHSSSNTLISTEQRGGVRNWRASEACETLSGATQSRFRYTYLLDTYRSK